MNWNDPDSIWPKVWKLPVAQRVRTFIWLLLKKRLLINEERSRRGFSSDKSCSLCLSDLESIDHVIPRKYSDGVSTEEKILRLVSEIQHGYAGSLSNCLCAVHLQ